MPYEDAMPKTGNPFHLERVNLNEQEQRRLINRVEDISKAIFRYRRVERHLMTTKRAAYTGLGLGVVAVAMGGFMIWTLWDRGGW